jgi:hypothetical protein
MRHDHARNSATVRKALSSAHGLASWRTSYRMLTNGAIVAQGRTRGAAVREPLHRAGTGAPPLSLGSAGDPSRLVGRDQGRRGTTSNGYLQ